MKQKEYIEKHIATHTVHSAEDRSAVSYLESVLNPEGRICTSFSCDDKWPNHDGFFEYVSNPDISKIPKQNFIVQIKGTHDFSENNGVISYCLKSLSFPAFITNEVTADPGILFVVLNPDTRNGKRIFWKVMSKSFLSDIDFEKNSKTIKFSAEDEIKNTDESIELFCERLDSIIDTHLFLNKLNSDDLEQKDALSIIEYQCNEISHFIETLYDREILMARMNYGETVPFLKMVNGNLLELDLNFSLDFKPSGNSEIMCKMLSDVCYVELDDIGFKTLKLTDFIIHLCAHLYKEATTYDWVVGRRDLNLYKFSDINVLLRKMLDEKLCRALVERIKEFDIKNECYYTFYNSGLIYPKLYENQYFKQLLDGIKPESLRYMKQIVWPVKKELYEYQHDFIEWFLHKDRVNELKLVTEE